MHAWTGIKTQHTYTLRDQTANTGACFAFGLHDSFLHVAN